MLVVELALLAQSSNVDLLDVGLQSMMMHQFLTVGEIGLEPEVLLEVVNLVQQLVLQLDIERLSQVQLCSGFSNKSPPPIDFPSETIPYSSVPSSAWNRATVVLRGRGFVEAFGAHHQSEREWRSVSLKDLPSTTHPLTARRRHDLLVG